MAVDEHEARSIFITALERSPEQWPAFLDEACRGDLELRTRVLALLQAHNEMGTVHGGGTMTAAVTADQAKSAESPGSVIGPYKLIEQLGEGGMGAVHVAEQTSPVRRVVALKLIKPGMDSRQVLARFGAERQALALMDHPNIAKVLDAGTSEQGRPYFVMELVKGKPITEYCDENRLTPRQRLELFLPVCAAVQHAHQKGIIHRDIKPSNVLVGLYDGKPVPKVIDFGVAKAIDQKLTEQTLFTGFGAVIGTPEYMSPEQAQLDNIDIDTRSDVYSLGVLLYELLTGTTPLQSKRAKQAALLEVLRLVREEEPPKPSSRLSTTEELPNIAANRSMEPARLTGAINGDLDWIVMKCLEKNRNHRYETANGFAADLQRYLADEAVEARPPSPWYRFRKFARRNRGALAAGLIGIMAVLAAVVGLAINNRMVTREKEQKEAALERALREKTRADRNLSQARRAVKEYLLKTSDNPLLKSGDFQDLRKDLLKTALPFYEEFAKQKQEDPELEAERGRAYQDLGAIRRELGDAGRGLSELSEAEDLFRSLSATVPDQPKYALELAGTMISRGVSLSELAKFEEAEKAYRDAHAILEPLAAANPGPDYRAALAQASSNLGDHLRELGQSADAELMLRRAITIRERLLQDQPDAWQVRDVLAQTWVNLGGLFHADRRVDDARLAFEKAVELLNPDSISKLPPGSALFVNYKQVRGRALNNLGVIHLSAGRLDEAEKSAREALRIKESLVETFPSVPQYRYELASSFNNLGNLLASLKRQEDARTAFEKALRLYERLTAESGAIPIYTVAQAGTYTNLGRLVGDGGRLEESLPFLVKGVEILEDALRRDSREVKVRESLLVAHWARAMTLAGLSRFAPAVEDWSRAIDLDDGRYRNSLLLKRASTLLNLKDHTRAIADADALSKSPDATAADLYNVACVYAIASRMATDDAIAAKAYADRAVVVLGSAVNKGFKDAAQVKSDSDLDALRDREDFKSLLSQWEVHSEASQSKD